MTQEELNALMEGDLDDMDLEVTKSEEQAPKEEEKSEEAPEYDYANYRPDSKTSWPPPPPTDDHKMVHQLDDVTRDSEIKANEVFDKLETINNQLMDMEEALNSTEELFTKQADLFTLLHEKFPNINRFKEALDDMNTLKEKGQSIVETSQMAQDEIMMTMDIMQYQDIHRQKIERVINVMRALSKYMNSLFEGKIDDERRVGSAVHIEGDNTDDVVSNEDIEALIAKLGK